MAAYYNEHDAQKAAWLRELMRRNLIAPGEVDERSVEEVQPDDLGGFDQCHWFAGIGVWSHALRNARWSDSSPVWTGSCPCPSFSSSGKGEGFSDPRHLWPAWFRLIEVCRPHVIFGEQVASDSALSWLDVVSSDLEGADYTIGAADLCAAGVGAPHIRQRLYFVADTESQRTARDFRNRARTSGAAEGSLSGGRATMGRVPQSLGSSAPHVMAHPESERCREAGRDSGRPAEWTSDTSQPSELGDTTLGRSEGTPLNGESRPSGEPQVEAGRSGIPRVVGDSDSTRPQGYGELGECPNELSARATGRPSSVEHPSGDGYSRRAGEAGAEPKGEPSRSAEQRLGSDGFWSATEWLPCRDGKARPVEPGTFPLAHGAPARVVRLRGYGDAIVAPLAQAFIEAYREVRLMDRASA